MRSGCCLPWASLPSPPIPELQAADAPQGPAPATALAEPLTRELRVLELLASGYSNAAMAEKLFVSDSTVRTHLRSINLKLGARSRTRPWRWRGSCGFCARPLAAQACRWRA